jgi:hypothetical protein
MRQSHDNFAGMRMVRNIAAVSGRLLRYRIIWRLKLFPAPGRSMIGTAESSLDARRTK